MRPGRAERERTVGELRSAFAGGAIGTQTFELRLGEVLGATTRRRLRRAVADLPRPWWRRLAEALRPGDEPVALEPPEIAVGETLVVGRDPAANLVLGDPSISRRHVELRRERDGWSIADLGSTNGTYVNGWRVDRARLAPGDVLALGDVRLRWYSRP
jgi:hypothetical protein